jgi:hypothetical protein
MDLWFLRLVRVMSTQTERLATSQIERFWLQPLVMPAKAGIQSRQRRDRVFLDSGLRRNDGTVFEWVKSLNLGNSQLLIARFREQ